MWNENQPTKDYKYSVAERVQIEVYHQMHKQESRKAGPKLWNRKKEQNKKWNKHKSKRSRVPALCRSTCTD